MTFRTLARITGALGARTDVRLLWQGEALDRLLDAAHAELVERVVHLLAARGWTVRVEVTYNLDRERGSIDVLAWHALTGSLLVVEVKSVVPDVQAMLMGLDRKQRVAPRVAREVGWRPSSVSRVLVLPDDRTARRRVASHTATFDVTLPARTVAVRRWLRAPSGALAGVLFVSGVTQASARHRVRPATTSGSIAARPARTGVALNC